MDKQTHNENIINQFSKQAFAYTAVQAHSDGLDMLIKLSQVSTQDNVLDVACGSGIVSCEFAKHAKHVVGVDITKSMLKQARELQYKNKLANIDWIVDDVCPLIFKDNQFSIVISRFSFHHFIDYVKVFEEMIRVCQPGGTIMVVDVALPNDKVEAYDTMEKLRDPSHAGVLSIDQLDTLFSNEALSNRRKTNYTMTIELETQLNASFPDPSDKEKLKTMIINDVDINTLGVDVKDNNGRYSLHYPIHIYVGHKK